MNKLAVRFNIFGFSAFLFMFGIALKIGQKLYKYFITPLCWVLWQGAKVIPEEKADPNPHAIEKIENTVAKGVCGFVDKHIFKTKELESEKWLKEHPEFK